MAKGRLVSYNILLLCLCYTGLKLRILLRVSITYALLLFLEGVCGFLGGYSLALSQVVARPQSTYCLDCMVEEENPGKTCMQCLEWYA